MLSRLSRRTWLLRSESSSSPWIRYCTQAGISTSLVSMIASAMVDTITMPVAAAMPPMNDNSSSP